MQENKVYLVLANGTVMEGTALGARGETVGEIVFTTGMVGYLETLTDPSYYGQIVVQTFPLIGNYGVIPEDFESSEPHVKGYIVRECCEHPSNFRCQGKLDDFLREKGVIGIQGLDTRALTRMIREEGVMNGKICTDISRLEDILAEVRAYTIKDAVAHVTTGQEEDIRPEHPRFKVALWDFGAKGNIQRRLCARGCEVVVFPAQSTAQQILNLHPDGIMLSNGPGDPAENTGIIAQLAELCRQGIPTFGICLGHQLLALSQGARTEKLKYGHRGANQPVREQATGRVFMTSQNHGYAVVGESLPEGASVSFINANDGTCEGVRYRYMPAFSVQFHPEAAAGPLDTDYLFDDFIRLMQAHR